MKDLTYEAWLRLAGYENEDDVPRDDDDEE